MARLGYTYHCIGRISLVFSRHAPFVILCLIEVGMTALPYPSGPGNDLENNYYHEGG